MNLTQITAAEAFSMMQNSQEYMLIDVRTEEEWATSGIADIDESKFLFLSWRIAPDMSINPEFSSSLEDKIKAKNMQLFFICRGGTRSNEAAEIAKNHGFNNCFNIIDGFEGSNNGLGWKNSNLPFKFLE